MAVWRYDMRCGGGGRPDLTNGQNKRHDKEKGRSEAGPPQFGNRKMRRNGGKRVSIGNRTPVFLITVKPKPFGKDRGVEKGKTPDIRRGKSAKFPVWVSPAKRGGLAQMCHRLWGARFVRSGGRVNQSSLGPYHSQFNPPH